LNDFQLDEKQQFLMVMGEPAAFTRPCGACTVPPEACRDLTEKLEKHPEKPCTLIGYKENYRNHGWFQHFGARRFPYVLIFKCVTRGNASGSE
jgi:hypothetical protein